MEIPQTSFEEEQLKLIKDLHLLEQMNKYPELKKYVLNKLNKKTNDNAIANRNYHIIALFYCDYWLSDIENIENSDTIKEFKNIIKDKIKEYKKNNKTYFVKTFCNDPVPFDYFGNIDMVPEILKDGSTIDAYSAGNSCHFIANLLHKDIAKDWLVKNQGNIGDLAELKLLADSPYYNIFEYKIPINDEI